MSRAPDAGDRVKLWRTKEERETLENHAGAHSPTLPHAFASTPFGMQVSAQPAENETAARRCQHSAAAASDASGWMPCRNTAPDR